MCVREKESVRRRENVREKMRRKIREKEDVRVVVCKRA